MLKWNVGNASGTYWLEDYLDLIDGSLEKTVAALVALGAEDEGPGDKTTHEFQGTFNGAVFTLYDYYGDGHLHIGGRDKRSYNANLLDVAGLKAALHKALGLA